VERSASFFKPQTRNYHITSHHIASGSEEARMGNQSSSPAENSSRAVNIVCDDNEDEEHKVHQVPEASDATSTSNASTGSSTSCRSTSDAEEDREEDLCPMNPYRYPNNEAPVKEDADSTPKKGTSDDASESECYRLPIFKRKSSPLTVLHSFAGDDEDEGDGDGEQQDYYLYSTCFPRTNSNRALITATSATDRSAASPLSFQSCRDAFSETLTLRDDGDDAYPQSGALMGTPTTSSSLLGLGCVGSPLMPKSNSWTNLMGLDGDTKELSYTDEEISMVDGDLPTPESDLNGLREYWLVTTAALPWMTGTAVNPLLRAAYLSQRNRRLSLEQQQQQQQQQQQAKSNGDGQETTCTISTIKSTVTLVLPWLEVDEDRLALYGKDWEHATPQIQEEYIRTWLRDSAQMPDEADAQLGGISIEWYPARYHQALSSIFAMGDLCQLIPSSTSNMICIVEEPEHVNFYRAPGRESWRDKFPHVIGIIHTNYKAYAQNHYSGLLTGPLVGALSSLMVRAYCDKVVKLSPVLQTYAPDKEVVSNVHGIRQEFFQIPQNPSASRIYFIGKLLWAKGLDKLLELEASYRKATGSYFGIDIYGSGPQEGEIQKAFLGQEYFSSFFNTSSSSKTLSSPSSLEDGATNSEARHHHQGTEDNAAKRYWRHFRQPIPARFPGRQDHAQVGATGNYKIFVNPSITEVLCTTTAEAVAMGLWVLVPKHSSNEFFLPFGNCLQFSNRREFVELLQYCQTHDPPGWCAADHHHDQRQDRSFQQASFGALSWEAATQRLIETAFLSRRDARRCERLQPKDRNIQEWHYALGRGTRGDVLRKVLGGGPVADQSQYTTGNSAAATSNNNNNNTTTISTTGASTTTPSETASGGSSSSFCSSSGNQQQDSVEALSSLLLTPTRRTTVAVSS
jgi:digalactosyldiacylglycerol synthase